MNEQRKVIYKRRDQILEDADLREETLEYLDDAVSATVATYCVSDATDAWDIAGLHAEVTTDSPTKPSEAELAEARDTAALRELLLDEATSYYEEREQELGETTMRQIERQVMLNIIDQHWREHLLEMDYLQEGINLRAMGQRDPLVEWQREGFEMFSQMMHGIWQDFVRYVMHVDVKVTRPAAPADGAPADGQPAGGGAPALADADAGDAALRDVSYSSPEDPSRSGGAAGMAAAARAATGTVAAGGART